MKIAIVCCTPFHIFTTVHLKLTEFKNYDVDVYISNHFNNSQEIFKRVKGLNLFNNCYYIEDKGEGLPHKMKLAKMYLTNSINSFIDFNLIEYNSVYIFAFSRFSVSLIEKVKSKNQKSKIYFVEDGVSTYTMSRKFFNNSVVNIIKDLRKVLLKKHKFTLQDIDGLMLYEPSIYQLNEIKNLIPIPKISSDEKLELNKYFDKIFNKDDNDLLDKSKFIYFDQSFGIDGNPIGERELLQKITEGLNDKVLLKPHPRERKSKYSGLDIKVLENQSTPWEVVLLNVNLEKKVLITISSSAIFASKLLLDEEPAIVLLYKLVKKIDYHNEVFEDYIVSISNAYKNGKLFIPNTMEELNAILNSL